MGVYKRIALVALALWLATTFGVAYVLAVEDTQRAELDALLTDLDGVKGERRIVLVGSSQVVLGLSADRIMAATGIPARNAAVYEGRHGFRDYFRIVVSRVRPKDIVVVSPPVGVGIDAGSRPFGCADPSSLDCLLYNWKPAPRLVDFSRRFIIVSPFPNQRTAKGDVVFGAKPGDTPTPGKKIRPTFSADTVRVVREQAEMIRARGACPVFAFPPQLVLDDARAEWQEEFDRARAALRTAGLEDVVVGSMLINTDPRNFYHDDHHMNPTGRNLWTQMLLDDLLQSGRCGIAAGTKRAAAGNAP